jgi:hypothetical protein
MRVCHPDPVATDAMTRMTPMSFDLQLITAAVPAVIATPREHAIYRNALSANHKRQRASNIADLLERGHRSRPSAKPAVLVDILA